jgi:hypothetical protein
MKKKTTTKFVADDGTQFNNKESCESYERRRLDLRELLAPKLGEYQDNELLLGGHAALDGLPFNAPWMSAFGACFINVSDVRRKDGVVEFQLADELCVPYNGGTEWRPASAFYSKWPD